VPHVSLDWVRLAYEPYDVGETILLPVRRMATAFMA
jgi:hypothetical protein